MQRVMLVDDEYMILKGMTKVVDWRKLGFKIVATERDAKSALSVLQQQQIDLVITDVRMPQMSGIELMRAAQELPNSPLFIVLSGYQEFEYVQSAMRLGAMDYLVKPVNRNELARILVKVSKRLAQRRTQLVTDRYLIQLQTERLLTGELKESDIQILFKHAGVPVDETEFTVLACNAVADVDALADACLHVKQPLFFSNGDQIVICFIGTYRNLIQFVRDLEEQQLIAGPAYVTAGQTVNRLSDLTDSFEQAQTLAELYHFYEQRMPFLSGNARVEWLRQAEVPKISIESFKQALTLNDKTAMLESLEAIFQKLEIEHVDPSYARQIAFLIFSELSHEQLLSNTDYEQRLNQLNSATTLGQLSENLRCQVAHFQRHQQTTYSQNVNSVLTIINQQYQNDLSLAQVADQLHLNPMYLGQLFKKELQTSFSKYLNNFRIKKAQAMLTNTNESIANIATAIGYRNSGYFYKNFRLICGISPNEYRQKQGNR